MSTTQAPTLGEIQGRDEPAKLFRRYVFNSPEVCSCCFRRLKSDHLRVSFGARGNDLEAKATRAESVREHKTNPHEIGPEGPLQGTRQVENTRIAKYPTRTVCEDCGSVSGRALDETLPRRDALDRCDALAERLLELGEPIGETERHELREAVRMLKSDERIQGLDTEIFERAVKVAVTRARKRR